MVSVGGHLIAWGIYKSITFWTTAPRIPTGHADGKSQRILLYTVTFLSCGRRQETLCHSPFGTWWYSKFSSFVLWTWFFFSITLTGGEKGKEKKKRKKHSRWGRCHSLNSIINLHFKMANPQFWFGPWQQEKMWTLRQMKFILNILLNMENWKFHS